MARIGFFKMQVKFACLILSLIIDFSSFGQVKETAEGSYVVISGVTEKEAQEPLSGVTVELYEKNNKINSVATGNDGIYSFKLDIDKEYTVRLSKGGLVSKNFYVNTAIPDFEKKKGTKFEVALSISLFEACANLDLTLLKSPVVKIVYSNKGEFNPDKTYDRVMLDKLQQLMKNNDDCWEEQYQSIVRKADRLFNEKKYLDAKDGYEAALKQRKNDKYVKDQLAEIRRILAQKKNNDNTYNEYIAKADKEFNGKNYLLAREWYANALELKPDSEYPKKQIAEIDRLLAEKEKQEKQQKAAAEKYKQAMDQGNDAANSGNYAQAKQAYQQALITLPGDPDASRKLSETENLIQQQQAKGSEQKKKTDNYNNSITKADGLFNASKLNEARSEYQNASNMMPDAPYPKNKISEIDDLLKKKTKDLEKNYKDAIAAGDDAFYSKKYPDAKQQYQKALTLKPNDSYASTQINTVDKIIADQQKKNADQKTLLDAYNKSVADGDKALKTNDLNMARSSYQKALQIMPDEDYPKQKIKEIDNTIKNNAKQSEQQYNAYIKTADKAFDSKAYTEARDNYQNALYLKTNDSYANNQLTLVNKLIIDQQKKDAEQQKKQTEQKTLRDNYNKAIADGDNSYKASDMNSARSSYQRASQLFPDEPYPKQQIAAIDNQIKIQLQKTENDNNYKKAISEADGFFNKKQYDQAKPGYQKALTYRTDDVYAKSQLDKADKAISENSKKFADQKARQDAYDKAIADADKLYMNQDFDNAKINYQKASGILSDKPYPKQRISDIDKLLEGKKQDLAYKTLITDADNSYNSKNYDDAKTKYKEALGIKPNENYPTDRIKNINTLLAKIESDKQMQLQNEKKYNDAITRANELFDKAQYDDAKKAYENASAIRPDQSYPKQRIVKINEIKSLLAKDVSGKKQETPKPVAKKETLIDDLKFTSDDERQKYLKELVAKYPAGITCEVYKEKKRTVYRYIVVRNNEANDFRELRHYWGGVDYLRNDKPVTQQYFLDQTRKKEGEYFTQTNFE